MKLRPECPICVTRYCQNCFDKDVAINRLWLDEHFPNGECRRCGAVREILIETPVRHTNRIKHQEHVDGYAAHLLTKPVRWIDRSPIDMAEALGLLALLENPVMDAILAHRSLVGKDDPHQYFDRDTRARNWNEGTEKILSLVPIVRRWVEENTGSDDDHA